MTRAVDGRALKAPFVSIDFRIRDFLSPAAIWRTRRLFERTQWLPPDDLRAFQDRLLREQIAFAYERVPYYRDLFDHYRLTPADITCADDLHKLPLLGKEDVRRAGDRIRADGSRHAHAVRTSGTTGSPVTVWLDRQANVLEFVYYWRHWSWAGYRLGQRFAELGSHFFVGRPGLHGRVAVFQRHLNRLMLSTLHLSPARTDEFADAIRRRRPRFLKGLAGDLYFLAVMLSERGIDDIAFQAVFSTGETLLPAYRTVIERTFHCRALDSYGHMERTVAVSECPEGGYHVNAEYGILELADVGPRGADGTVAGIAHGTALHNRAMPLIRYEIGDLIEPLTEKGVGSRFLSSPGVVCPCGRTLPLVKAVHGREQDVIVTPDGRVITSLFLVLEFIEGVEFGQFVQETPDRLTVSIVRGPGFSRRTEEDLLHWLRQYVGAEMRIDLRTISRDEIARTPTGKVRPVISHVPPPGPDTRADDASDRKQE